MKNYKKLSHEDLRGQTKSLKKHIKDELKDIQANIDRIKSEAEKTVDHEKKTKLFESLDKAEEQYNKSLEKVLDDILPQAFAIVKETARRFKENEEIEVKAEDYDIELANKKDFVDIEGDKAIWYNTWEAAGNNITWDMVHYDVQIMGGVILHQGKVAEMATGEGKTLVSTLPAFLNALAGKRSTYSYCK